jgi:hypothetical protein
MTKGAKNIPKKKGFFCETGPATSKTFSLSYSLSSTFKNNKNKICDELKGDD